MPSNGYTLTQSEMINEWILKYERLCIATKRGLNGVPFTLWFNRGRCQYTGQPLLQVVMNELKRAVDIAYIGGPDKERLASCVVAEDDENMIEIETCSPGSLNNYYPSYF